MAFRDKIGTIESKCMAVFATPVVFTINGTPYPSENGIYENIFVETETGRTETMPSIVVKSTGSISNIASYNPNDTAVVETVTYYILEVRKHGVSTSRVILSKNKQR